MFAQSRQMNENSSANGIVTATMSAERTENSIRPRMTSTMIMPRARLPLTVLVVSSMSDVRS